MIKMPKELRDLHVSGLRYVSEADIAPPSNVSRYKRISIPYNPDRKCLGYIEGPAASLTEDTRNGRGYILKLWKNVEASSLFIEGMNCAIIVGELDHPEERINYSLSKGCVVLTDWEIREDEGIVWARFAILDNAEGHTLLSYVKFGSVLGVSSRGLGDEIMRDGRNIIDPDTYEFYCFDVVAFPAAKIARTVYKPSEEVVESVHKAFSDRVIEEANGCDEIDKLQELQRVVEATSTPDKDMLVETISHKLSSLSDSADNQRTAEDDEAEDPHNNDGKEILLGSIEAKDEKISALEAELARVRESLRKRGENAKYFRKTVQEKCSEIENLETAVSEGLTSINELSIQLQESVDEKLKLENNLKKVESEADKQRRCKEESNRRQFLKAHALEHKVQRLSKELTESCDKLAEQRSKSAQLSKKLSDATAQVNRLETKVESLQTQHSKKLTESVNSNRTLQADNKKLQEAAGSLKRQCESLQQKITSRDKRIQEAIESQQAISNQSRELLRSYVEKCCSINGISIDNVEAALPKEYTKEDADALISKMADRKKRYDMLPLHIPPINGVVTEHYTRSHEDATPSFVVEALKRNK